MRSRCDCLLFGVLLGLLFFLSVMATSQQRDQSSDADQSFILNVAVDEVSLTFHVADKHGKSLNDLSERDVELRDQGKLPRKVAAFRFYHDLPVRVGFLLDASGSMLDALDLNEYISNLYATEMLRKGRDQAFVMGFGAGSQVTQDWTDQPDRIASGIRAVPNRYYGSGTAIFDSLYKECRDRWSSDPGEMTGNFILLFTDGIDDMSHARIGDAIDMCQRTRTAIYVFTNQWNLRGSAQGAKTLEALTSQSGGRIFLNPSRRQIKVDIEMMDNDQRTQYLMDFIPDNLVRDGSFHRIKLRCKAPGTTVLARSGYYAIPHRN